jgi:hypothetical protein
MKRGTKNKTYRYAIYGFQVQVLVDFKDQRPVEKTINKKMKDLNQGCGSGSI